MPTVFLLPETVVREDGQGAEVPLATFRGKPVMLTLAVTRILERQTLEVIIVGSPDRLAWQPVAAFPKKSYCRNLLSAAGSIAATPKCAICEWNGR